MREIYTAMKKQWMARCTLALTLALPCSAFSPVQELRWSPPVGAELRRELRCEHFLTAELMRTTLNGDVTVSQRMFDLKTVQSLSVTDEFRALADGRPSLLRRYYDKAEFETVRTLSAGRQQTKDHKYRGRGSVTGQSVVFTWVPEDHEYGRYYDSKEGIEEVLPGLVEDLGMRSILPPGALKVGQTWELEPKVLGQVFATGGDPNYVLVGDEGFALLRTMQLGMGLHMASVFGEDDKGKVTAMFTGTEEVEGRELALIYLQFDVQASRNVTEQAARGMSVRDLGMGYRLESARITLDLEGTGTLRWDTGAGHLYDTRDLHASQHVITKLVQVREREEGQDTMIQELAMVGNVKYHSTCSLRE